VLKHAGRIIELQRVVDVGSLVRTEIDVQNARLVRNGRDHDVIDGVGFPSPRVGLAIVQGRGACVVGADKPARSVHLVAGEQRQHQHEGE